MFIKTEDYELWNIITKGPYVPMTTIEGKSVKKNEDQYTQDDFARLSKNCKAMHILYCGLDANEYNRISACESAKEMWDKLVVTYEGTSQVRETKINMLVHQYELFKMQPGETIKEMFTRFTDITNNLKSLGKTYTNEEMVRKVLRCLPKSKWGPKVTAIEEAQDLKTLAMDDLLGKLLTHEIHLKEDEEELQPKKGIAFKTTREEPQSSDDESSDSGEDSMAIIARGLKKMLKTRRFDPKKFYKKGSSSRRNEKISKGNTFSNDKNNTNLGSCFGCGSPEHAVKDCPVIRKKAEKWKQKAKEEKQLKRAMIAAWSDSDSSDNDNEEEKVESLFFMANEDLSQEEETEYESSDEVDYSEFLEYTKKELAQALIKCIQCEQVYLSKIKSLKKTICNLISEKECLEKLKIETHTEIVTLQTEKNELQSKCKDLQKLVLKFSKGQENLDKLLGAQRISFNKEGIGYNPLNKKKTYKNLFVQEASKITPNTICNYCLRKGHISHLCPLKKPNTKIIQVWVPKGTRPQNIVSTYIGPKFNINARKV